MSVKHEVMKLKEPFIVLTVQRLECLSQSSDLKLTEHLYRDLRLIQTLYPI